MGEWPARAVRGPSSRAGIAAMAGAAGEYLGNAGDFDVGTLGANYLVVLIGAVTFTGSTVAFAKLSGMLSSKALALPGRDQLNLLMLSVIAVGVAGFLVSLSPTVSFS